VEEVTVAGTEVAKAVETSAVHTAVGFVVAAVEAAMAAVGAEGWLVAEATVALPVACKEAESGVVLMGE
jgi:hypothetical protein